MNPATPGEDFPFVSKWVEVKDATLHYVEAGEGQPVLFLHGNPTWSYTWRNVLPLVSGRCRAIAVDLVGMGRSSKPDIEYRFSGHADYLDGFIEALGLEGLALVGHDWGSALAFHYARRNPGNVSALAFFEAILAPVPAWGAIPREFRELIRAFRDPLQGLQMIIEENAFVEKVLPAGILRRLTDREMEFYREPYREPKHREPLWRWPNEIPIAGDPADVHDVVAEYSTWLEQTQIPKLLLHADPGTLIDARAVDWCRQSMRNLTTIDLGRGVHYLQEDHGPRIGQVLAAWLGTLTPKGE